MESAQETINNLKKINLEEIPKPDLAVVYKSYSEAHERLGDFEVSLNYLEKHLEIQEALILEESKKNGQEIEAKFQIELKAKEQQILKLQKYEVEQKALRTQLNPHFFFNALNSINRYILENDTESASRFVNSFSNLMKRTLENSEQSFISVEDEIAYLQDYLSIEQLRFKNTFHFSINVGEEIDVKTIKIPAMMLQPFIENSIKHGVGGLQNKNITVDFILQNDAKLLCIVEDDGRGRVVKSKNKHKSMGTRLLDERIAILKEQLQLDFSINTIDLINNQKEAIGTRVEVLLPNLNLGHE